MTFNSFKILFTILTLAVISLVALNAAPWWWLLLLGLLAIAILAYGSATIQSNFFVKTISSFKTKKELILTFDDGPHPNTLQILEVLKKHNANATFFCIGKQAEQHPEVLKQIIAEGHMIGNHTQNHSNKWGFMQAAEVKLEIEEATAALEKLSGRSIKYFRPPFGVTNPRIGKVLKNSPLLTIGWDLRSLDTSIKDVDQLWKRVEPQLTQSSIVLFHDTQPQTIEVLDRTLNYCQANGIKTVSLDEKLQEK